MKRLFPILVFLFSSTVLGGSYTISSPGATDCRATFINGRSGKSLTNFGQVNFVRSGYYYGEIRGLIDFEALADSMRQVVNDSGSVTWDSAIVGLTHYNVTAPDDSIYVSVYKVIRMWEEGLGDGALGSGKDTCGACWDSANAAGYSGCSGTAADWGTDGCDNTGNDRSSTRETFGSHADSILIHDGISTGTPVDFYISGSTVTDTLGEGLIFIPVDYGDPSPPTNNPCIATFYSDDYTTIASRQPKITVYYTPTGGGEEPRRRRRMLSGGSQ